MSYWYLAVFVWLFVPPLALLVAALIVLSRDALRRRREERRRRDVRPMLLPRHLR